MSRRKNKQYSQRKKMSLIKSFENSGESAASFCRTHKISPSSFCVWRKKLREKDEISSSFLEVPISLQPTPIAGIHCGKFTLSAPETLSLVELTKILRSLEEVSQ